MDTNELKALIRRETAKKLIGATAGTTRRIKYPANVIDLAKERLKRRGVSQ